MERFYLFVYTVTLILIIVPLLVSKPVLLVGFKAGSSNYSLPISDSFLESYNEKLQELVSLLLLSFKNLSSLAKKMVAGTSKLNLFKASFLFFIPKREIPFLSIFRASAELSIPSLILLETQTLWYVLLAINILSGIAILLYMRNAYIRKKENLTYTNKLLEMEAKALSSQMNPHFIYNSLCTVQHLILINENQRAFDYISDFSLLMRQMLNNSRKSYVALEDEIDFLHRYLQLEKFRFSNSFNYRIEVDEVLKVNGHCIPPMIIQPIIENAIKHGLAPKKEKDALLKIELSLQDDILECIVDDNGMGWRKTQPTFSSVKYESTALNIIRERLKLIKSYDNNTGRLEIIDKHSNGYEESGTTVKIYMPIVNTL